MSNDKPKKVEKSTGRSFYGSQEAYARESMSASTNAEAKTGKPRPPTD